MSLFDKLEYFFIMNEETNIELEFVFLFFIRIVLNEDHLILRSVILLQLSPVIVFKLLVINIIPLHALLENIKKSVDDNHELFRFWLG